MWQAILVTAVMWPIFWWASSPEMLRKVDTLPWQLPADQRATFNYEAKSRLMRTVSSFFFAWIIISSPDATPLAIGIIATLAVAVAVITWIRATPLVNKEQARIDALGMANGLTVPEDQAVDPKHE